MTPRPQIHTEIQGDRLVVRVPVSFRKSGGRRQIIAPPQGSALPASHQPDQTLLKAIARGHRWRDLLENGDCSTVKALARKERIAPSYLSRVLRLTLLSPAIVEAVVEGRPPAGLTLTKALAPFPLDWAAQMDWFA
ncbi:hypothetical protein, partial [Hyphobacterium vulgare]